jgi:hypothetical protein
MTAFSEFDVIVQGLMRFGTTKARAEVLARQKLNLPLTDERDPKVLEKEEQTEIARMARAFGFKVDSTSQYRPAKVSGGFPDLWLVHTRLPIALWWEVKRQVGGRFSAEQLDFAANCARCGVGYGSGDRHAFAEKLIALGIAYRDGDRLEPTHATITSFDVGAE